MSHLPEKDVLEPPPLIFDMICTAVKSFKKICQCNGDGDQSKRNVLQAKLEQDIENAQQEQYTHANNVLLDKVLTKIELTL